MANPLADSRFVPLAPGVTLPLFPLLSSLSPRFSRTFHPIGVGGPLHSRFSGLLSSPDSALHPPSTLETLYGYLLVLLRIVLPFTTVSVGRSSCIEQRVHVSHSLVRLHNGIVSLLDVVVRDVRPHPGNLALAAQLFQGRALRNQAGLERLSHAICVLAGSCPPFS